MGSKASILEYFLDHAAQRPTARAAMVKREGAYRDVSWAELAEHAREFAKAIVALGAEPGDRIAIVSSTRVEWIELDMAVLWAGAVTVPIYPSNLADECQYVTHHSDAVIVFAEDAEQVAKFIQERERLPQVRRVVQIAGDVASDHARGGWVIPLAAAITEGQRIADEELDRRRAALHRESILTIIYTSGTTGRPKGVVLPHSSMLYEAEVIEQIDFIRPDDIQLLFLPLAHVFAKVLEVTWLSTGHVLAFAESFNSIRENLAEVKPTVMCGVPRVFEKFYAAVVDKGMAAGGLRARLLAAALDLSRRNGEAELGGPPLSLVDKLKFAALKRLVFRKIHQGVLDAMGGRMRATLSGGAPLPRTVGFFFRDADIMILEGYGLTETSAGACVNRPELAKIGTVGPPLPGTSVRIADDGEILIRGPGVLREYWKDPEATAEAVRDGWFYTGDIGEVDAQGYVRITDRKKDLIVTAGGKNVAPQKLENLLKAHPLIAQAVIHGDRRPYLTALITIDADGLAAFAKDRGLAGDYTALTAHPQVRAEVDAIVRATNAGLASYETIKRHTVLDRDFSQDTGELTPKLSVRRKVVDRMYAPLLDAMYDGAPPR